MVMKRTLMVVGALAVVALALLIVACGSDPAPTSAPAATTAPTAAPTAPPQPTAPPATVKPPPTAAPTRAPTRAAPAPTPPAPTQAAPTPTPTTAPEDTAEADPSDAFFAMERVLEVSIEIDPEDWDTLRHQTRTFDDLMAEIEKYNLSRPFASIYDWFSATVTIDGETHTEVGVRKKGFLGSQSDTKPSLKLRYDKYVDGQSLGGVIERMTLNNSIQDPSMVNTCLAYQVFAAAGSPASRCNFATVTVNGKNLGLYVHVEEIKKPMLARHFNSAEGNLYEGTISDFTPDYRGTIEKKTNEDENDWSDVDAVMAALQDPSDAGLEALGKAVDLDRFLTFWATEVLVGHWDGYTGDRNNYHFYREPDGKFVFIPWGVDDVFHLKDDPNPFDEISNPPPSVLALSAIPNRLYNIPDWRAKYAVRMKEILNSVWNEEELLDSVDQMAAIVQQHSLPKVRDAAAKDTERVRKFILKRKGEILADITPEPPDWPEPSALSLAPEAFQVELRFETTWGTKDSLNPFADGSVSDYRFNGLDVPVGESGATAGLATAQEAADVGLEEAVYVTLMGLNEDFSISGITLWMPPGLLESGAILSIGEDGVGGVSWELAPGETFPEDFTPIYGGVIELSEAGMEHGAAVSGRIEVTIGGFPGDGYGYVTLALEAGTIDVGFETAWGTNKADDPFSAGGKLTYLTIDEFVESVEGITAIAGHAGPDEQLLLPDVEDLASIAAFGLAEDGYLEGMTLVLSRSLLTDGATLVIGQDQIEGGIWSMSPGAAAPEIFVPFTEGQLELTEAGTDTGAVIRGIFSGSFVEPEYSADDDGKGSPAVTDIGLVINEVAAKGDPMDWFELHNTLPDPIGLFAFLVADDLMDAGKRVAFPPGTEIQPGEYLQFEVDNDNWAGFKLGGDEELGIWLQDGTLVAMVDWDEGDSGEGESYARIPDATGDFQTVGNPTPGAANQP